VYIKSLQLKNFKRFKDVSLKFPGDITVIKGPNEQGKSSLVQALIAVLFYDSAKSNEAIKGLRSWGGDRLYTLSLAFEAGGDDYILEKDFEQKTSSLKNTTTGNVVSEYGEIMKTLKQLGGYQSPDLFINTACIKQGELAILDKKKTVTQALQDIVGGAGVSVSVNDIFKRIVKAQEELKKGLGGHTNNPGVLVRLKNEFSEHTKELEQKKTQFREEDTARQRLGSMKAEREAIREKLEIKETLYKKTVAYLEISKVLQGLNIDHKQLSKKRDEIESLQSELGSFKKKMKSLEKFRKLDMHKYLAFTQDTKHFQEEIDELEEQLASMEEKGLKVRQVANLSYVIPGVILFFAGFLGVFISRIFLLSWVVFLFLVAWVILSKTLFQKVTKRNLKGEVTRRKKQKEDYMSKWEKEFKALGVQSVEDIEQKKSELNELEKKIGNIESKMEGMLGSETKEGIAEKMREIEKRIGVEEAKIAEQKTHRQLSPEEQEALEREIAVGGKQVSDLEQEILKVEAYLSQAKAPYEDVRRLEEKLFTIGEEYQRAQKREQMLSVLSESLAEAQQKTFRATGKVLEEYMGNFLSEITEGKYEKVSLGPSLAKATKTNGAQMKIKVTSVEKGEEIDPEGNLSKGTLEQLYLVARFALVSLLYGTLGEEGPSSVASQGSFKASGEGGAKEGRPLVILDDPFGNFDAKRKARTRHILKRLSQKFQIVLLTCSDEYDKWGEVVTLK